MNFNKNLFFAPMEGITDEAYRKTMMELYPEWDLFYTDFLRIPVGGRYTSTHILEHFGQSIWESAELREKTVFQILTSFRARNQETISTISNLGIKKLDLNLGCPSRTVVGHGGGSYLLEKSSELTHILECIRKYFNGTFSVKMRIGMHGPENFLNNLKIFQEIGIDYITIHARTRDQLYKGLSDWQYIKAAKEFCSIPIIGNGDIWNLDDIKNGFERTNCDGIMCARGAMGTPWLARTYKYQQENSVQIRLNEIKRFHDVYKKNLIAFVKDEAGLLKRIKSVIRYFFDELPNGAEIKSQLLRTQNIQDYECKLYSLIDDISKNDLLL